MSGWYLGRRRYLKLLEKLINIKLLSYLIDELSNNLSLDNSFFIVLFVIIYLNYFEFKLLNID